MGLVVALGEPGLVQGFALAGAAVVPAEGAEAVRNAWAGLGDEVSVVILTDAAAEALPDKNARERILCVVIGP